VITFGASSSGRLVRYLIPNRFLLNAYIIVPKHDQITQLCKRDIQNKAFTEKRDDKIQGLPDIRKFFNLIVFLVHLLENGWSTKPDVKNSEIQTRSESF
jgi:hypothetical protein